MKFQLKALAVALSLVAVSVPAHAGVDAASTGNGSFILTLIDKVANISATFDLGKNYADFNQVAAAGTVTNVTALGTVFSWNLSQGDYANAWNSFFQTATLANTNFGILAADNLGAGAGSRGYITTYASAGASTTGTALITALGNHDTYVANAAFGAGGVSNMNVVDNGASFSVPATFFYNGNKNNNTGPVALGNIGTSLRVAQATNPASNLSPMTTLIFANDAKFTLGTDGVLTYMTTPVPEADTWAMMVAGLGLMGFVARRRSRNQA